MGHRDCSIDGCGRAHYGRGWCKRHYQRWAKHGDPLTTVRVSAAERVAELGVWLNGRSRDECWNWTGRTDRHGYGVLGKAGLAHRVSWESEHGSVPAGHELDHLCRNTSCVNPDHMEAVTHQVNVLRGASPVAVNAAKTHCLRGHEFTPENTYRFMQRGSAVPARQCRACVREREQQKRAAVA